MSINNELHQVIYFGAPGTGKSYQVNQKTKKAEGEGNVFRTTFHPDSDYASFVGSYKPTMSEGRISYAFVPQTFTNAYVRAWKHPEAPVYLVVEEINRGNCAQIFGDLFQLLDRGEGGVSEYPIQVDEDLRAYLETELGEGHEGIKGGKLRLPSNLYIYATMNTSDQSLFPMDSAFKRRWSWQYVPISKGRGEDGEEIEWVIEGDGQEYSWWSFLEAINQKIGEMTHSEDKKLGFFFCKASSDGMISAEEFVSKVVFYLWHDVFRLYGFDDEIFKDGDESVLTFDKFYGVDEQGKPFVREEKVNQLLNALGVKGEDGVSFDGEGGAKKYKYTVNGTVVLGHRPTIRKAMELYVKSHPEKTTAKEIVDEWKKLKITKPSYFVETESEYKERRRNGTDKKKRALVIKLEKENEVVYLSGEYDKDNIDNVIEKINGADWGITIKKVKR